MFIVTEVMEMIVYDKLFAFLESKDLKRYYLYKNGIDWPSIHRLEENKPVKTSTLSKICLILECDISDICHFDPNGKEKPREKKKK